MEFLELIGFYFVFLLFRKDKLTNGTDLHRFIFPCDALRLCGSYKIKHKGHKNFTRRTQRI